MCLCRCRRDWGRCLCLCRLGRRQGWCIRRAGRRGRRSGSTRGPRRRTRAAGISLRESYVTIIILADISRLRTVRSDVILVAIRRMAPTGARADVVTRGGLQCLVACNLSTCTSAADFAIGILPHAYVTCRARDITPYSAVLIGTGAAIKRTDMCCHGLATDLSHRTGASEGIWFKTGGRSARIA